MNRPPDQVTDEDIAHLAAYSDTASSTAIAYACDPHQFALYHDKLQSFWEWWVESAFPEAWQKASIQPEKTHHTTLP